MAVLHLAICPKDMRNMEILTPPINLMMKICQLLE